MREYNLNPICMMMMMMMMMVVVVVSVSVSRLARTAGAGEEAHLRLWQCEVRVVTCNDDVASQRGLKATTVCDAVDCSDHRFDAHAVRQASETSSPDDTLAVALAVWVCKGSSAAQEGKCQHSVGGVGGNGGSDDGNGESGSK